MHGWWQDHTSWLTTAQRVREKFGHDCLLLDWPGHGLSETPRADVMGADLLLAALRRTLERVGWADGATPLTLCGCSPAARLRCGTRRRGPPPSIVSC